MGSRFSEIENELNSLTKRAQDVCATVGIERIPQWQEAFGTTPPGASDDSGEHRPDLVGRFLIWIVEPPPKFKAKAQPRFQPVETGPVDQVLPVFLRSQEQLQEIFTEAKRLPVDRLKIPSPLNDRVNYSVWSSFLVTLTHQRRHMAQAERAAKTVLSGKA